MNPSKEQVNGAVRTLVASGGGLLAGWAIGKGWISQDQAAAILSNQEVLGAATTILLTVLGAGVSALVGVKSIIEHKPANLVAAVAAMPEVAKVEVMPTPAGTTLKDEVPPTPGAVVTVASPV